MFAIKRLPAGPGFEKWRHRQGPHDLQTPNQLIAKSVNWDIFEGCGPDFRVGPDIRKRSSLIESKSSAHQDFPPKTAAG
jgi:hypothetical protein